MYLKEVLDFYCPLCPKDTCKLRLARLEWHVLDSYYDDLRDRTCIAYTLILHRQKCRTTGSLIRSALRLPFSLINLLVLHIHMRVQCPILKEIKKRKPLTVFGPRKHAGWLGYRLFPYIVRYFYLTRVIQITWYGNFSSGHKPHLSLRMRIRILVITFAIQWYTYILQ